MTPAIITVGSYMAKYLLQNLMQGKRRIQTMLNKIEKGHVPPHMFWMELTMPEQSTIVGKGNETQPIYPPIVLAPADMNEMSRQDIINYLTEIFVGPDIRAVFEGGLYEEGQQWQAESTERLMLTDGNGDNGNGNGGNALALTSGPSVQVLPDGSLSFPELKNGRTKTWVDVGFSIPGLFESREAAASEFNAVMKIAKPMHNEEYKAWKMHLGSLWADKADLENEVARKLMERNG